MNILEQENILEAVNWAGGKKHSAVLSISFVYELHKRMFNRVWKWAGKQRDSDKNIGVPKEQVATQLKLLLDDVGFWIQKNTYEWDEIAARFHHRLVAIHAFANGNGRHARLLTDILLETNGQAPFSWGMKSKKQPLDAEGVLRTEYINALRAADSGDLARLIKFVKS